MSRVVISAENISKQYRLGEVSTGTISHDLNRWLAKIRGKDDPFLKIGDANDRTSKSGSEYVWALKDINFDISQGEVLGIIGKNGAGKSTLLKLLSKVTQPTTGKFKIRGRIASLLEVGTGFHPELTGRENVFLNGAILGMTKSEIKRKFDEIVAFAGVEKYIDTPVKRYSSGMYVRLAFAVAAHLETDILVVDEVLAVGDADFQRKCIGKMNDASSQDGKSVLFVSHNLSQVQSLCRTGILLEKGTITERGEISKVIDAYINHGSVSANQVDLNTIQGYRPSTDFNFESFEIINEDKIFEEDTLKIAIKFKLFKSVKEMLIGVVLADENASLIECRSTENYPILELQEGAYVFNLEIPLKLKAGMYTINLGARSNYGLFQYLPSVSRIEIMGADNGIEEWKLPSNGIIITKANWNLV